MRIEQLWSRAALMTGCYPKRIDMATGSNFGVLLAGGLFGARAGALAGLVYVGAAAAGAPVLADGAALDVGAISETKSLGYLAGFAPAAAVAALARGRSLVAGLVAMTAAHAVVLALGAAWLTHWLAPADALERGVAPYLAGAGVKGLAAACIVRLAAPPRPVAIAPGLRDRDPSG